MAVAQAVTVGRISYSPMPGHIPDLTQGFTMPFTFTLDDAIVCPQSVSEECSVVVYFQPSAEDLKIIQLDTCYVKWITGQHQQTRTIIVKAAPTVNVLINQQVTLIPLIQTRSEYYQGFAVPPIVIKTNPPVRPSAQCYAVGDPHMSTFDGGYWHYYDGTSFSPVRVTIVQATRANRPGGMLRIQAQVRGRPALMCAIAALEGNNLVIINVCDGNFRMETRFGDTDPKLQPVITTSGNAYTVTFASGAWVRAECITSSAYMNTYFLVPGSDSDYPVNGVKRNDICGFCGNFDGDASEGADYPVYATQYYSELSGKFACLGVDASRDNFNWRPTATVVTPPPSTQGITCNIPNPIYVPPVLQPLDAEAITALLLQYSTQNNQNSTRYLFNDSNTGSMDPTMEPYSSDLARQACVDAISANTAITQCVAQFPTQFTTIYLERYVQSCTEDVMSVNGDPVFISDTINAILQTCREFASNLATVPPSLANILCPNQCSGHGTCLNSNCTCVAPYMDINCGTDPRLPPTLQSSSDVSCDLTGASGQACPQSILVGGQNFYRNSNMRCKWTKEGVSTTTVAIYLGFTTVACALPVETQASSAVADVYRITISNDGTLYSQTTLNFTFYNGICQVCTPKRVTVNLVTSTQVVCAPNPGSCTIGGTCHLAGSPSPTNPCMVCNTAVSSSAFSYAYTNLASCSQKFTLPVYSQAIYGFANRSTPVLTVQAANAYTQADAATVASFTYSIVPQADNITSGSNGWFVIDAKTGVISANRTIDLSLFNNMEYMAQNPKLFTGTFRVKVVDQHGITDFASVIITLLSGDKKPAFDASLYTATVPENATVGLFVLRVHANDTGTPQNNSLVRYSIHFQEQSYSGYFAIDAITGQLTVAKALPHYVQKSSYLLQVRATASNNLWYLADVQIAIAKSPYPPNAILLSNTKFNEATINGTVGDLTSLAPNDPTGSQGTYAYQVTTGQFFVQKNQSTNVFSLRSKMAVDYNYATAAANTYSVSITTTDTASGLSFSQSFSLALVSIQRPPFNPIITLSGNRNQTATQLFLKETELVGTTLGVASAMAFNPAVTFFCQLSLSGGGTFGLANNNLLLLQPLSFATVPSITIEFKCSDDYVPTAMFTPYKTYTVSVLEQPKPPRNLTVAMDSVIVEHFSYATPTQVGAVTAFDYDTLPATGRRITFAPVNDGSATYTFTTGPVVCIPNTRAAAPTIGVQCTAPLLLQGYLKYTQDLTNLGITTLSIVTTDEGGLASTATVAVPVSEINNPPTDISLSTNTMEDVVTVGQVVAVLTAVDENVGQNHTFVLTNNPNNAFALSPSDGQCAPSVRLVVNNPSAFKYETNPSMTFSVATTDCILPSRNIPGGLSATVAKTISVTDTPMRFVFPTLSFPDDATPGVAVATISLANFDQEGLGVSFSLIDASSTWGLVSAGASSTSLTLLKALDSQKQATYSITFIANFSLARRRAGSVPAAIIQTETIVVTFADVVPVVQFPVLVVPYNSPIDSMVGHFSSYDERNRLVVYTLTPNAGLRLDEGNNLLLKSAATANTNSKTNITVLISVADGSSQKTSSVTLTVQYQNSCETSPCVTGAICKPCLTYPACPNPLFRDCSAPPGSHFAADGSVEPDTDASTGGGSSAGMASGVVVGIAIGCVLLVILVALIAVLLYRRNSRLQFDDSEGGKWADAQAINPAFQPPSGAAPGYSDIPKSGFEPGVSNPMYDWYCPDMSRQECVGYLEGSGEGAFVIRDSAATPGWHMMGVKTGNEVMHEKIRRNDDGQYELMPTKASSKQPRFKDLPTLVEFYTQPHEDFPYILAVSNPIYDNHQLAQAKFGEARPGYILTDPMAPVLPLKSKEVDHVQQIAGAEDEEMYTNSTDAKKALQSRAVGSFRGNPSQAAHIDTTDVGYLAINPEV